MSLYQPMQFINESTKVIESPIDSWSEIPKEWDIFFREIEAFLPEGKTLDDLTPEELKKIRSQYRFDPMRPGVYQGLTGIGPMR